MLAGGMFQIDNCDAWKTYYLICWIPQHVSINVALASVMGKRSFGNPMFFIFRQGSERAAGCGKLWLPRKASLCFALPSHMRTKLDLQPRKRSPAGPRADAG